MMDDLMLRSEIDLVSLVASRLCHDLVSPIGAIGNGVELLRATQEGSPELDLIDESTANASAKLRFFRIAFGAAKAGETVETRQIAQILAGLFGSGRLSVRWEVTAPDRARVQLLFLALLCAESALPLGGMITLTEFGATSHLIAEGKRTRLDPAAWDHLTDGAPFEGCSSAQVHFLLARRAAQTAGMAIRLAPAEGGFVMMLAPA